MIRVNLLDSVTDRASGVAEVEAKVASPLARTLLLVISVGVVMFLGMAIDFLSAAAAQASVKAALEREETIAARMVAINNEQTELEKKIKDIQVRIDAIKKLRTAQQGPVPVLSAINERIPMVADFRLEKIEQTAGQLVVEGHSPNEALVTQFARSLEFSNGLFSNVSIETERKTIEVGETKLKPGEAPIDPTAPKPETVNFIISCKYTPPVAPEPVKQPGGGGGAKEIAPAPKQIAQNTQQ